MGKCTHPLDPLPYPEKARDKDGEVSFCCFIIDESSPSLFRLFFSLDREGFRVGQKVGVVAEIQLSI